MTRAIADALAAKGRAAVEGGRHGIERPPSETGRWGPSAVLLAEGEVARNLDRLTAEAVRVVGPAHWVSGSADRAHFTVRALDYYDEARSGEQTIARYVAALERAAASVGPVALDVRGVLASPSSVMAMATSPDGAADRLRARFADELGPDGWLEDRHLDNGRDPIWYASLVHYAAVLDRPQDLLTWTDQRRDLPLGTTVFETVSICSWTTDGSGMRPRHVADVHLV